MARVEHDEQCTETSTSNHEREIQSETLFNLGTEPFHEREIHTCTFLELEKEFFHDLPISDGMDQQKIPFKFQPPIPECSKMHGHSYYLSVGVRVMTVIAALAGFVTMITNKQDVPALIIGTGSNDGPVSFFDVSAFIWFAIAIGLVCLYSLGSLVPASFLAKRKFQKPSAFLWLLFIFDLILMNTLQSACSASIAVAIIGKHGNRFTKWDAFCHEFDLFCNHIAGAMAAGIIASILLAQLCILDTYQLYNQAALELDSSRYS